MKFFYLYSSNREYIDIDEQLEIDRVDKYVSCDMELSLGTNDGGFARDFSP